MSFEKIFKFGRSLLPSGRAFKMQPGGDREKLHRANSVMKAQLYADIKSTLDSIIPDNDNFTEEDATDWERRLGILSNPSTSFADRKAAILRKMAAPGKNPAKSHYLWIQKQLRLAGFDVYVFENIFPDYPTGYMTMNPVDINSNVGSRVQSGNFQHGNFRHGLYVNHMVVRSLDNNVDIHFDPGESLRSTFFIGGDPFGTYANVPASREQEFRQLICILKQCQNVAILYITYT